MRLYLQLATLTLLTATIAHAQFHMPQLSRKEKDKGEDVSWLAPFATPAPDGRGDELLHDPHFRSFLRDHLTAPQTFWNENEPLYETALEFLGVTNQVILDENRYLAVDGCVLHYCPARGLLFVDLGTPHPLVVFAAIDWIKENKTPGQSGAEYTLWLFSNRPLRRGDIKEDAEAPAHIPEDLRRTIARWTAQPSEGDNTQNITHSILVDPDGTPQQVEPTTLGVYTVHSLTGEQPATETKK